MAQKVDAAALKRAVTFYGSFDEEVKGDYGGGGLLPKTRFDHPQEKGKYVYEDGFDREKFRIAKGKGIFGGGALEALDVLPRRGRMFFPGKGNLPYKPDGWSGAVSFFIDTNPDTMLKTSFCDPVQITEKGAGNGGFWCDFPDVKPRDMRLGAFPAVPEGGKPIPESDPNAPLIIVKQVGFKSGDWHHVVLNCRNFDTGRENAEAELFVDGQSKGRLSGRNIAMKWNLDHTGIYFAVSYIGLMDELAVFNRPLTPAEIEQIRSGKVRF